jgi:hypothetical protein
MSTLGPLAAFLAALAVYLSVVFPDVPGGDAGELLAESCVLGTAHPPGYPLLTAATGGLFRLSSALLREGSATDAAWPNPALLGNALAAAFSAGAAALVYAATREVVAADARRLAAAAAAGNNDRQSGAGEAGFLPAAATAMAVACFSFSPLVMLYAASAEVFALNNALSAALMYSFVRYTTTR